MLPFAPRGSIYSCSESVNVCLRHSFSSDPEQVEPGAKQQAAATEGASEQAQHGSDAHGQANQRAAGTPV